jgi:adenosylmethionine-8-amino-7-oxononanoate aminotransferase
VIGDVRGEGLLIGVEFVRDPATRERFPADVNFGIRVREAARRRGLLLRASHWMVALAPPLTITTAEVDEMLDLFEASLGEVLGTAAPERAMVTGVGGRTSA